VFEPAEFGVVTSLYAWTAFLNVVLTFGMETTFFRFANKDHVRWRNPTGSGALRTATYGLLFPRWLFMVLGTGFSRQHRQWHRFRCARVSVLMLVLIIGIDAHHHHPHGAAAATGTSHGVSRPSTSSAWW
jgi:O-antigen/teichoic acid export membrane protein